jgi:hypothetical protein
VLRTIVPDAAARGTDLAARLGILIEEEPDSEDWSEYVVPDLRSLFDSQLAAVAHAVESAAEAAEQGAGSLWIRRNEAELWYGALNQARLALEDLHRFHDTPDAPPGKTSAAKRSAWLRSQFYLALQGIVLDHLMG